MFILGQFGRRQYRFLTRLILLWTAVICCLASRDALAQPGLFGQPSTFSLSKEIRLDEIDTGAKARLAAVDAYVADRQWTEAIAALVDLAGNQGQKIIAAAPGRYVSLQRHIHHRIAALPLEALKAYRKQVDSVAEMWYRQSVAERDAEKLGKVVEQFFASSWGDDALLALGEIALEQGEYQTARMYWEPIHPALRSPDGRSLWMAVADLDWSIAAPEVTEILASASQSASTELTFPDTDLDVPGLRARLALASILEGSYRRAEVELDLLERLHPDATGRFGGREVVYADSLGQMLTQQIAVSKTESINSTPADWPTFAGLPSRTGQAGQAGTIGAPAWSAPIELAAAPRANLSLAQNYGMPARRVAEDFNAPFSYYPIVAGENIYVADGGSIFAYDLRTGEPAWGVADGAIFQAASTSARPGSILGGLGVARFLLTVDGDRLYARLGSVETSNPPDAAPDANPGYLVCLDLAASGRLVWKVGPEDEHWAFDGAPIAAGDRVYVAMRRGDVRPQAHVACLDATTGEMLWRQYICSAETPAQGQASEITSNLLTLAGGMLYFNTNMGAVAALDAVEGQVRWITTYPRSDRVVDADGEPLDHFNRDIVPSIVHRGLVITAPSDSGEIFALESATGRLAWTCSTATDVVHLLGVDNDTLLASGRHLWWIDADTGKAISRWPDSANSGEEGFARGVLAGDEVFWPTRGLIRVFDAKSGRQTREPLRLDAMGARPGNLVIAKDRLLIASNDRLYGFKLSRTDGGETEPLSETSIREETLVAMRPHPSPLPAGEGEYDSTHLSNKNLSR